MESSGRGGPKKVLALDSTHRMRRNWEIHLLYVRKDFDRCLEIIEKELASSNGLSEYPLYVKALILRHRGKIQESLKLFQVATCLNPHNVSNLKQVGRSLFLLGKHSQAIEVYKETQRIGVDDWETWHNMGLCYLYLKDYDEAAECFHSANEIARHTATYIQLGKLYTIQENFQAAMDTYQEALAYNPDNPDLLTTIGLLHLRLGDNYRAFENLGSSLAHDARNTKTILAAGSIMQETGDTDVALVKYRVAAQLSPNSPQLWSNIGMCFFGLKKYAVCITCLKRALYLAPFEWIICYNLGLAYLATQQYASAFHYFSSCINLKNDFPAAYMYLAIALAHLNDYKNSCAAYERALEKENDPIFHLNYAITLYNFGEAEKAAQHFASFDQQFQMLDDGGKGDTDIAMQRVLLQKALY